jgi:acyl-CoA reductase-like NAD-dependent aldehyde dehydrogenase
MGEAVTGTAITTQYGLWIDGESRPALSGATFTRENPFDRSIAAELANGDEADAAAALDSARRTFDAGGWPATPARERHGILRRAADLLAARVEEIAARMVLESGKPITLARAEVLASARCLDFNAGACLAGEGSAIGDRVPSAIGLVLREPVGVAGIIPAWNFPLLGVVNKLAAALAAGCTAVAKPSHLCPSPAILLAHALTEAGLPDGVFNVVTSDLDRGAVVGQQLAASRAVDKIAFTGSTRAGQAVMRAAAANTKRLSLELGGKSANIVFDDAPFEDAARTAITAFCFNSGQQCSAGSRLLLQEGIHDRFLEAVAGHCREQVLGDPRDDATTMGPLISDEQLRRVTDYIDSGREEGELIVGGGQPAGLDDADSLFVEPTVFDRVANDARIAREEIFGPVLSVIPFRTEEEAVALANASQYGLAGAVWTRSIDRALRVAKAVRTGKMFVNAYNTAGIEDMPHGGCKDSGFGREFGLEGLQEYQELKTVQIKIGA